MKCVATCRTDLSRWNAEVDLKKVQSVHGTFYLVTYDIYFTLEGSSLSVESVFAGEVVGKCEVPF